MTLQERHGAVNANGGYGRTESRGLIEVTGGDRQTWLHNLTTNVVTSLTPGDGNYAFAITVQGRTLFDLNALIFEDRLWIDIDARWLTPAMQHFEKYIIVEDVHLKDISADWSRFQLLGLKAADCVEALGLGNNFAVLADVQHVAGKVDGVDVRLIKNNLGPIPRAEWIVPRDGEQAFATSLAARAKDRGMVELDAELFNVIRIEAGYPASVDDIDNQVIPPETLQVERGISYVKGCYLGQEVIERMRSRGSMARKLVGMQIAGDDVPEHDAPVFANGKEVGRVTSACRSVALDAVLALGYLKVLVVDPSTELQVAVTPDRTADGRVIDIPLNAWR